MAFKRDKSKTFKPFEVIPEGDYEVMTKTVDYNTTNGGTLYIDIPMVIRNDVEQECKNQHIWHAVWKKKDPSEDDLACEGFSYAGINQMLNAVNAPEDAEYAKIEDCFADMSYKPVHITVEHQEYNGKTQARIRYVSATNYPDVKHEWSKKDAPPDPSLLDDDGDLPF